MSFPTGAALQKADFKFIQHSSSWKLDILDEDKGAWVELTRLDDTRVRITHYGLHKEDDFFADGEDDESIIASFKGRLRSDNEFEILLRQLEITE